MDSMNAEPNVVGIGDTRRPPLRLVMTVIPPPVYASSRAFTWVSGVYLRSWPFMRLFFGGGGGAKITLATGQIYHVESFNNEFVYKTLDCKVFWMNSYGVAEF